MDREPQDEHMSDVDAEDTSPQISPTIHENGLPTPLTATSPTFPPSSSDHSSSADPSTEANTPRKGKGKRVAEDEFDASSNTPMASFSHVPDDTAPQIVRRHRHRRRNVAATVWGPSIPGSDVRQPFNVYKAMLRHPNLFFQFAIRLPIGTMVDLYAIDKEFHYRFNKYSTSIVHDFANYHAPHATFHFSWPLFPELCISDPMMHPMDGRPHLARDIPTLRWAKMVLYRDKAVRTILTLLAMDGLRVPRQTLTVLMKFWLLMEMNTTLIRKAFITDPGIWSDQDIYIFHLFLMKLDMHFNHPVFGHGFIDLSHMLLAQKSLGTLYRVMTGEYVMDYDEGSDMLVKTYTPEDLDTETHPWLDDEMENGVPFEEAGVLCREGWEWEAERMAPAIDMLSEEAIRRNLDITQYLADFVTYGFVDPETHQNIPAPRKWRHERKITVPKESWPTEDVRTGMLATVDRKFGIKKTEGVIKRHVVSNALGNRYAVVTYDCRPEGQEDTNEEGAQRDAMME